MSRYLIDQLATRPNIHTRLGVELEAVHGAESLEAIDVHDSGRGRLPSSTRAVSTSS